MQEVKKCSISGVAFTLEMDAWDALSRYLDTLHQQYREHPDGEEIIADIEARIAELILSTQDNNRTVELPLIKNIVAQMGSAEQIDQSSETSDYGFESGAERSEAHNSPRIPRRLYRDSEGSKLGGVCSGLGRYFDVDPVWIRLVMFSPLILMIISSGFSTLYWLENLLGNIFGVFIIGYLVMWFAVPTARTARQKLEMNGERITTSSIKDKTEQRRDVDGRSKAVVADTVSGLGLVMLIFLKIVAGFMVAGLILFACTLIIGLFFVGFSNISIIPGEIFPDTVAMLGILAMLIPAMLLIYVLMCLIASSRPSGKTTLVTFLLWVVVIMSLCVSAILNYDDIDEYVTELPTPTRNERNLLSDDFVTERADSTTNTKITMEVDESGLVIDVKELQGDNQEAVRVDLKLVP